MTKQSLLGIFAVLIVKPITKCQSWKTDTTGFTIINQYLTVIHHPIPQLNNMKHTRFIAQHRNAGAKMVEFAGFEMPIQYPGGIVHEHNIVRNKVGVFDVSHMGEFDVRGTDALAFLQKITVNDVSKLTPGKAQYSAMCKPDAGIVDDLLVYMLAENHYMMVVNGACEEKDWAWALSNTDGYNDLQLTNISDDINLLAIQGPKSLDTLQKLTDSPLSELAYYSFTQGVLAGVEMIISRTGYTGELGFEIYFRGDEETAGKVWSAVFTAGAEYGIEPIGLGARDTLRLEKGYCLYGNDITEETHPLEAGLGWITKLAKGTFNGSDVLVKAKEQGLTRKLVGLTVSVDKFIARSGYEIVNEQGEKIGAITSGNISPILGKAIALGYVPTELSTAGSTVLISARGKTFPAEVTKIPFL